MYDLMEKMMIMEKNGVVEHTNKICPVCNDEVFHIMSINKDVCYVCDEELLHAEFKLKCRYAYGPGE